MSFDLHPIIDEEHWGLACRHIGSLYRPPDLVISPDGNPYLYRWHVIPRNLDANIYFHVQVASDPERPLHDHPWDNTSIILAGGYNEIVQTPGAFRQVYTRRVGDIVHRPAEQAHRLVLPGHLKYTMTLFVTGPKVREWGFWCYDHRGRSVWVPQHQCIVNNPDGTSVFKEPDL